MTTRMITELTKNDIFLLTEIINAVFKLRSVPKQWKEANIRPKFGKKDDVVDSYRPIQSLKELH